MFSDKADKAEITRLTDKVAYFKKQNSGLNVSLEACKKERDTLKAQVREQAEADILINALKAVGIIKQDGPAPDYRQEHNRSMGRLQAAGAAGCGERYFAGSAGLAGYAGDTLMGRLLR